MTVFSKVNRSKILTTAIIALLTAVSISLLYPSAANASSNINSAVNTYRANNGLTPLKSNSSLDSIASSYAKDMASQDMMYRPNSISGKIPGNWVSYGAHVAYVQEGGDISSQIVQGTALNDYTDVGSAQAESSSGWVYGVVVYAKYPVKNEKPSPEETKAPEPKETKAPKPEETKTPEPKETKTAEPKETRKPENREEENPKEAIENPENKNKKPEPEETKTNEEKTSVDKPSASPTPSTKTTVEKETDEDYFTSVLSADSQTCSIECLPEEDKEEVVFPEQEYNKAIQQQNSSKITPLTSALLFIIITLSVSFAGAFIHREAKKNKINTEKE